VLDFLLGSLSHFGFPKYCLLWYTMMAVLRPKHFVTFTIEVTILMFFSTV